MTHRTATRARLGTLAALVVTVAAALMLLQSPTASARDRHLEFSINLGHPGYYLPPPPPPVIYYDDHHVDHYPAYPQPSHYSGGGHYHGQHFCRARHGHHGKHKIKYKHRDRHHDRDHDDDDDD